MHFAVSPLDSGFAGMTGCPNSVIPAKAGIQRGPLAEDHDV